MQSQPTNRYLTPEMSAQQALKAMVEKGAYTTQEAGLAHQNLVCQFSSR